MIWHINHSGRPNLSSHINCQCFLREFIDQRQALYLLSVRTCIEDKVV